MKMFKTISVFILLFTGYLCDAQEEHTTPDFSPPKGFGTHHSTPSPEVETYEPDPAPVPGRSLPTLVVAGVSIALVLLCILIVAVFWFAWRKSQEGSAELNPIPHGVVKRRTLRMTLRPESQQTAEQ